MQRTNPSQSTARETILDMSIYQNKSVRVKFSGGREVTGILKGYDPLVNLVLEDAIEYLPLQPDETEQRTRSLGRVVCRGPQVILVAPTEGYQSIENPFQVEEQEDE